MNLLIAGQRIEYKRKTWLVENVGVDGRAYLRSEVSSAEIVLDLREQKEAYTRNQLKMISDSPNERERVPVDDPLGLSQKAKLVHERREAYLKLVSRRVGEGGRKAIERAILIVAEAIDDNHPPSISTYYRWEKARKWRASLGQGLLPQFERRGNRKARLSREVQNVILDTLEEYYLTPQRPSLRSTVKLVTAKVDEINSALPATRKHRLPGYAAVRGVLKRSFDAYYASRRRDGSHAAHVAYRLGGKLPQTDYPMQLIQLDHSHADILSMNKDLTALLGRPTVSAAIDSYSGMILGVQLGFEPPSNQSLFSLFRNMVLPKNYVQQRWPDIETEWECFGPPNEIYVDRGAEFLSEAFDDLSSEFGVKTGVSGTKRPYMKGAVERLWSTMSEDFFQRLPGSTFSNTKERGEYDSAKQACLAFHEIERLLHRWIIEVYANQPKNPEDNRTRRELWIEGQSKRPHLPLRPLVDFGVFMAGRASPTLNGRGVRLHNQFYISRELEKLYQAKGKRRVKVRYDPGDMTTVQVFDPENDEWIVANNVDPASFGKSLYLLNLEQKSRRGTGSQAERLLPGAVHTLALQRDIDRTVKEGRKTIRRARRVNARAAGVGIHAHSKSTEPPNESAYPLIRQRSSSSRPDIDMSDLFDE